MIHDLSHWFPPASIFSQLRVGVYGTTGFQGGELSVRVVEPLAVNLPRVSVPKLVERNRLLHLKHLGMVILGPGLVEPRAVCERHAEVGQARAKVHIVGRVVAGALAVAAVDDLLNEGRAEHHSAAAGRIVVAESSARDSVSVALPQSLETKSSFLCLIRDTFVFIASPIFSVGS